MPALLTHYLFGESLTSELPAHLRATDAQVKAFLVGNQGPDPFFFAVTSTRGSEVRSMGSKMHDGHMAACFDALRRGVGFLPPDLRGVGAAFVCGMLGHYVLDRNAHPYVYAQEFALCDDNPELSDAYHEVHALIESDMDCGMLRLLHGQSVAEFAPVEALAADESAERAAGALLAQCASEVFGLALRPTDYPGGLADMRLCYRSIEPAGSPRSRAVGALERAARPHSQMEALAHRVDVDETCAAMNPRHLSWENPFADPSVPAQVSTEGFPEVFERARADYAHALACLLDEATPAAAFTSGVNYEGQQLDLATESRLAYGREL